MAFKVFERFFGGINLKPKTATDGEKAISSKGDLQFNDADNRLHLFTTADVKVLADEQIDITIPGTPLDSKVPSTLLLNTIKGGLDTNLSDHITDITDAHDASAISSVASGNLVATDVQSALNELQSDIDTRALDSALTTANGKIDDLVTLSGVLVNAEDLGTFTGVTIPDASTVKGAFQAIETSLEADILALSTHISDTTTHGTVGDVVGTSDNQILTTKTIDSDLNTISNLTVTQLKVGVLDTDLTTVSLADDTIPSAKATKAALDLKLGTNDVATLTNKSLVDSSTLIVDVTDNTKVIKFDAIGTTGTSTTIASSQTVDRVLTLPDETDTLATQTNAKAQAIKYAIALS